MVKFLAKYAILFSLAAPSLVPAMAHAEYYREFQGQEASRNREHPWDIRVRRPRSHTNFYPYVDEDAYYSNPFRSVTHALHPLHRKHYYDLYDFGDLRYRRYTFRSDNTYPYLHQGQDVVALSKIEGSHTEEYPADCRNFTVERPNYRVPPGYYNCN